MPLAGLRAGRHSPSRVIAQVGTIDHRRFAAQGVARAEAAGTLRGPARPDLALG